MKAKFFSINESLAEALELMASFEKSSQVAIMERALYKTIKKESSNLKNKFEKGRVFELLEEFEEAQL